MKSQILIEKSKCPEHNLYFQGYCSYPQCNLSKTRLCQKCLPLHYDHKNYLATKMMITQDLTKGLKKCFQKINQYDERSNQLTKLIYQAINKAKEQYSQMDNQLIQAMRRDKQLLQQKINKIDNIYKEISQKQRLTLYFTKLKEKNLISLRIKFSSTQGILNFKLKNQKFCSLIQKNNLQSFNKSCQQFNVLFNIFMNELTNNSTYKLGQLIALKNLKRQKNIYEIQGKIKDNKVNNNGQKVQNNQNIENKNIQYQNVLIKPQQRNRSKSQTSIGKMIFGGIMNFFGR